MGGLTRQQWPAMNDTDQSRTDGDTHCTHGATRGLVPVVAPGSLCVIRSPELVTDRVRDAPWIGIVVLRVGVTCGCRKYTTISSLGPVLQPGSRATSRQAEVRRLQTMGTEARREFALKKVTGIGWNPTSRSEGAALGGDQVGKRMGRRPRAEFV